MDSLSECFIRQTSKDYDTAAFNVENIAKKSTCIEDFYKRMECYVVERESIFEQHRGLNK